MKKDNYLKKKEERLDMKCKYRIKPSVKDGFKEMSVASLVMIAIFGTLGLVGFGLSFFEVGLEAHSEFGKFLFIDILFYIMNGFLFVFIGLIVLLIFGGIIASLIEMVKGWFEVCPDYEKRGDDV